MFRFIDHIGICGSKPTINETVYYNTIQLLIYTCVPHHVFDSDSVTSKCSRRLNRKHKTFLVTIICRLYDLLDGYKITYQTFIQYTQ